MNDYCNTTESADTNNSNSDSSDHNSNSGTPSNIITTGKRKLPSTIFSTMEQNNNKSIISNNNNDHDKTRDDEEEMEMNKIHSDGLQLEEKGKDRQINIDSDVSKINYCNISSKWYNATEYEYFENPRMTKKFLEEFNKTPYLNDNKELQKRIDEALKIINDLIKLSENDNNIIVDNDRKVDNNSGVIFDNIELFNLTDMEKKCYDSMGDPEMKKGYLDELVEMQRKEKKIKLYQLYNFIGSFLAKIEKRTLNIYNQLYELVGLSQAETTITTKTKDTTTPSSKKPMRAEDRGFEPIQEKQYYSRIVDKSVDIGQALGGLTKMSEELKVVARHFDAFLSSATILKDEKKEYRNLVLKGLEILKDRIQNKIDHGSSSNESKKSWKAPGPMAYEKDGTQPYIKLLLQEIGRCCDNQCSQSSQLLQSSPAKNSVCSKVPIPLACKQKKQIVDFLLKKEGRCQEIILDEKLTIPFKVKPGSRGKYSGPKKLLLEAREQCLSQLAKAVFVGFHFAGYGVKCHATGIVANMAALQILHLRYEDVGRPTARLVLYESQYLPLMSKSNYKKWYESVPNSLKKQFEDFEEEVYGMGCKNSVFKIDGPSEVPEGMVALFNLMQKRSKELYGFDVNAKKDILGIPIGFGASSVVFRQETDRTTVIKLSRYGYRVDIDRERKILLALQKRDTSYSHSHLVHIASKMDELEVTFGSKSIKLPALELRPFGQPATWFFTQEKAGEKEGNLNIISTGVMSALEHLHHNNIIHGDVSPKNIIIVEEKRAVLIDFTISTNLNLKKNNEQKGFQGTTNYVHGEVFFKFLCNAEKWDPHSDHDFAALGYTLAYFANNCICPWSLGNYPICKSNVTEYDVNCLKKVMKERQKRAEHVFEENIKNDKKLVCTLMNLLKKDYDEGSYSLNN